MANPQIENGHVDIANEIMEALARFRIPGESRQILDFILRKTYGWHKKEDSISLSQFEEGTGLRRSHVCRAISKLVEMNLIYKDSPKTGTPQSQNGDSHITIYGFKKDFENWNGSPQIGTSPTTGTKGSPQVGNRVVPKRGHTKETIQKKTNKRKNTLHDVKPFIDFYYEKFKESFGSPPVIQGAKDGAIVKSLLQSISLEELKILLERMFESQDSFILRSGYTIGVFKSQINKLKIGTQKEVPKHLQGLSVVWQKIKEEEQSGQKTISLPDVQVGGCVSK